MNVVDPNVLRERESLLANAVRPVAGELRLIDVAELISTIWAQKYANLQDLVNSSSELYFRPGTLSFGWGAEARVGWAVPPAVSLDMEFQNRGVTVFFRLGLEGARASIAIRQLTCDAPGGDFVEETRRLVNAIGEALLRDADGLRD